LCPQQTRTGANISTKVLLLRYFMGVESLVSLQSNRSRSRYRLVPKPVRSETPWAGVRDLLNHLRNSGRLADLCTFQQSLRLVFTDQAVADIRAQIINEHFPPLPSVAALRRPWLRRLFGIRMDHSKILAATGQREKALSELACIETWIRGLTPDAGLDIPSVEQTMLYQDIEFARLSTIPGADDEEVYTQHLRFLRNPNTLRSYSAKPGSEAIRAARNMYEKTGNRIWKRRMQALLEENESLGEETGDLANLYATRGDFVPIAVDMSQAAARETIDWYERFDTRHPDFELPLSQYGASCQLVRCFERVGDLAGVLRMWSRLQHLTHLIPSAQGPEVGTHPAPQKCSIGWS